MEKEMQLNEGTVSVVYNYFEGQKVSRYSPFIGAEVEIEEILFVGKDVNTGILVCVDTTKTVSDNDFEELKDKLEKYHADESNFTGI